jgi:hypothetical protein
MERLPNPTLTPTSQEQGATRGNAEAMTAPGSPTGMVDATPGGAQIPVDNTREPVRYNPDAGVETRGGSGG